MGGGEKKRLGEAESNSTERERERGWKDKFRNNYVKRKGDEDDPETGKFSAGQSTFKN